MANAKKSPLVGVIMGSRSDWPVMSRAGEMLDALGIPYEARIVSAHRTPKRLYDYAAAAKSRGLKVIIAGAGGAAHLPGMTASMTPLPVIGVPVATVAIGEAGAANAGLLAAAILATGDAALAERLDAWRAKQTEAVSESVED